MGALVWTMMGLALWHFTIFVPDRFWAGIVGAFLGAVIGALLFGLVIHGFVRAGARRHRRADRARGGARRAAGDRRDLLLRRQARQRAALTCSSPGNPGRGGRAMTRGPADAPRPVDR